MASVTGGHEAAPSKRKSRRISRQSEVSVPYNYGPVVCTSTAALVQPYLTVDAPGPCAASSGSSSQTTGSMCSLHMSESRFDPIKLRFGGKSKPVCSAVYEAIGGGVVGSKGAHLNFGPGSRVVATSEAMNADLHCRCVYVLVLCEASSDGVGKALCPSSSTPSAQGTDDPHSASQKAAADSRGRLLDTAHLIALSPDDLFLALSVDSFPLELSPTEAENGGNEGSCGQGSAGQRLQTPTAAGALPRAFEILDGPIVVHRPEAKPGEPWRGLEVFRPQSVEQSGDLMRRTWKGQLVVAPPLLGDVSGKSSGGGGDNSSTGFRLDLAAAGAKEGRAIPSPSEPDPRSKKQAMCSTVGGLLVCPAGSLSPGVPGGDLSGCGLQGRRLGEADDCDGLNASRGAILAVPAASSASSTVVGSKNGAQCSIPHAWMSLSFDRYGRASLSPWRGIPLGPRDAVACLCRAPAMDSGIVNLASRSEKTDISAGLVVSPSPPTMYVGVANELGGSLMELRRSGALSCSLSLPAPPRAVMTAAVDDARGVLAVVLADEFGTALLIARDGSELPIVEQYRGVAFAHSGDFLGNGREQVAFFSSAAASLTATAARSGTNTWDQLPLKALVKRSLVTDCSCLWGNGRRADLAVLPGAGVIQVGGGVTSGSGSGDIVSCVGRSGILSGASDIFKGRKRTRTEADLNKDLENRRGIHIVSGDEDRLGRLSAVVGVLRRRVQAEEARLLKLWRGRRGKAAVLEAAELALVAQVEGGFRQSSRGRKGYAEAPFLSSARVFYDGQAAAADGKGSNPPPWVLQGVGSTSFRPPCCEVARVRFHAPSRTLCLDARVSNFCQTVNDVCLSVASASGPLTTRSAVCGRLCPGEYATIRSCVEVPPWIQTGEVTPLYASCTWCTNSINEDEATSVVGREREFHRLTKHCAIFARILVSPQDMLGVGSLSSSPGVSPFPNPEESGAETSSALCPGSGSRYTFGEDINVTKDGRNIGMFDVGVRLDLLVRSDTSSTTTTSLAALPQALRSLSATASSIPEPWAGGVAAHFAGCSERAAACTLRASDSPGASAVLLRVAKGALPDGVRASADHASEQGIALVEAAGRALREELVALEGVARIRRRWAVGGMDGGGTGGDKEGMDEVSGALERYRVAQMESDLLAARLNARIVAAQGVGQ